MTRALIVAAAAFGVAATGVHAETVDAKAHPKHVRKTHHAAKAPKVVAAAAAPAPVTDDPRTFPSHRIPPDLAPALVPLATTIAALPIPAKDGSLTYKGITVYGGVDMGIGYQSHGAPLSSYYGSARNYVANAANAHTQFGLMTNALSNSNIGIKGVEEIVPGLSFVFNAQATFVPNSLNLSDGNKSQVLNNGLPNGLRTSAGDSSRSGQIDNGQGYAGFSSPTFGTITFGRQNSLTGDGVTAYDPMSGSNAFALIGLQGFTGGAGNTEDLRYDNSLKYRVNVGPFRAGGIYQFERYGNSNRNAYQAQLGGEYNGFSFDAIYGVSNDSIATSSQTAAQTVLSPNTLNATVSDNYAFMLLASYKISQFKFYAGYENVRFTNPKNPLAPGTPTLGVGTNPLGGALLGVVNTAFTNNKVQEVFWGGVKYAFRPNIDLIGAYYHYNQNSYATGANAGCNSRYVAASCSGTEDAGSIVIDYRFNKNFDIYAGAMYSVVHGGFANGYAATAANPPGAATNTIDPTVGARFQF